MGEPEALSAEQAPLYVRWASGWYTIFIVLLGAAICAAIGVILFTQPAEIAGASTCKDLYVFSIAQFIMWSLIVVATATHYLTSFDACRPCHSGKCGFTLAICALLFGPLLVIASFAYACATESRFFNGDFDVCTNENGVRALAHAVAWTAIVAPIVVLIAYIVVVCCLRAAPADVAAAYQPVSQSDGAEASAASRV